MPNNKMKNCKHCGAEIAASAKVCPHCGGKNAKPIFKRWWFWLIVVIILISVIGSTGGKDSETESAAPQTSSQETAESAVPAPREYTACTVDQMMDTLDNNAMAAEETYGDQFVEITGRLSTIDSKGKYISLLPENDPYAIIGVTCYLENDDQKAAVMGMSTGQTVTLRGQITSVGEVLGYSLNIDEILP